MRIGILGGTFDPPHLGHLRFAEAALESLGLDEVIFMPAHRNPQKLARTTASARQRLEMVRRLVASHPRLSVSDLEITRGGPSYTVETLAELQHARPAEYWFLVGADALKGLPTWKQPQRLVKMCRLGVALRQPTTKMQVLSTIPEEFKEKLDFVEMAPVDISATALRDHMSKGRTVAPWLEPSVVQYIRENKLYGAA